MGYLGSPRVVDLRKKPKFVKITKAGFYESMVHNIGELKKWFLKYSPFAYLYLV